MTAQLTDAAALSIDAGQTGMKVRIERAGRAPIERVLPGVRTNEPLLPQLATVARAVAEETGDTFGVVSTGVSGLTSREADAGALLALLTDLGARRVLLAHDSITSFLGTLGDVRGAVVAAGTGVVTLGVGRTRVVRIDGWGNIMGDAGSGYWIGREGLDAAMRAYDGRGSQTLLLDLLRERWPDPETAYVQLQSDPARVSVVASFAEQVARMANEDATAARICLNAARELSHSARVAIARVADSGLAEAPVVSAIGGVFRSRLIRERFDELVLEVVPDARIVQPQGTGLDGVAALRALVDDHPLRALISVASR
jgi:N-acetylglucosamine kinase-like BadF-type ATPase